MIIVRSPLRISFAGGGTDLPAYFNSQSDLGFGAVCSIAINKYVYVTINDLATFFPHRFRIAYSQTELSQDSSSIKHPIVREALTLMKIHGGVDVNVMSDIPAGTGMGSSSTFTVSLLHALHAFQNKLVTKENLARQACELEIERLKEPIGKQDQYAAAFGGLNLIRFHKSDAVSVEPIPLSRDSEQMLLAHLQLFYLGGNRSASAILEDQKANAGSNAKYLHKMRDQALECARVLAEADFPEMLRRLGDLLLEGWELKKQLAAGITNSEVDLCLTKAMKAGALGGKLLGAGGTGFLLMFTPPEKHQAVREALHNLSEVRFEIDHMGSTLLYYNP